MHVARKGECSRLIVLAEIRRGIELKRRHDPEQARVPSYIQDARHGFGAALRAAGGVISTEQPRVART